MMSGKLDDFFRKGLQNIPDANPPPGQWEKIRRRELVVKPALSGFTGYWVVGSLLLGLIIGSSGMWLYTSGYPTTERLVDAGPVSVNNVAEETDLSRSTKSEVAIAKEEIRPAAVNPGTAVEGGERTYEESASPSVMVTGPALTGVVPSAATSQTTETTIANRELSIPEGAQEGDPEMTNTAFASSLRTRVRAEKKPARRHSNAVPLVALSQLTYPQMKRANKAATTLAGYASSAFIPLPKTIARRTMPAGRWEAGLSFAPSLTTSRVTSRVFTEQNNGNVPQIFNFNNQQIELFADDIFDQKIEQHLQLASINLEGARQFANGTRLGLGVAYSPYSLSGLNNQNDVLAPILLEGEFASYNWAYEKRFRAFMTGGYTFLRRRKVRPYLGVRVGLDFYQEGERKSYLLRGLDGRSEEFLSDRYFSTTGLRELIFNVSAQVGVQYQVHKRISLGVDLLPELAAGVRYRF